MPLAAPGPRTPVPLARRGFRVRGSLAVRRIAGLLGGALVATVVMVAGPGVAPASAAGFRSAPTPVVSGKAAVGAMLTATPGTWRPTATLKYQWYRGSSAITGATGSRYALTAADRGKRVKVKVTGSRKGYTTLTRTSRSTAKVAAGTFSAPVPTVVGTARPGSSLTAKPGTWTPRATLAYRWYRSGASISGATGPTYAVTAADVGTRLTVKVTGSRAGYTPMSRTSGARTVASGVLTAPVPTIAGRPTVGATLTVVPGTWKPAPVTLAYRWYRDGVPVAGATAPTYVVTAADAGAGLTARVTGSRTGYGPESRTSAVVQVPEDEARAGLWVGGTLTTDTTWTAATTPLVVVDGGLTVPAGVTLRIEPGVVVKFVMTSWGGAIGGGIQVEGTLDVQGSSSAPVVLTSYVDDTAGGDTNGDGTATSAQDSGNWRGITAQQGAHLTLAHLDQRFSDGVTHLTTPDSGAVSITDSRLSGLVQWGPGIWDARWPTDWEPSLTFARNTLTDGWLTITSRSYVPSLSVRDNVLNSSNPLAGGVVLEAKQVRPSWFTGNSTTTGGFITLDGELVEDWTVQDQGGLHWGVGLSMQVPAGVDIVLPAGTELGSGYLNVYGSLTVRGTREAPARLSGAGSEWGAVVVEDGGRLHAEFLHVETSSYGESISGGYGDPASIWVTDSELAGAVDLNVLDTETIRIQRTTVTGGGISVRASVEEVGDAVVTDNVVDLAGTPGPAFVVSIGELEPRLFEGNVSRTASEFVLGGTFTQDWTFPALPNLTWSPQIWVDDARVVVPAGTFLRDGYMGVGGYQSAGGEVVVAGTEADPVELEGVGLGVYYHGTLTVSHAVLRTTSSWSRADVSSMGDAAVSLDHVTFVGHDDPDLGACVYLNTGATGHLRGNLSGCGIGLETTGTFDARYVDWGDPAGPAPLGAGAAAVGPAHVVPWVGYTAPQAPAVVEPPTDELRCATYTVLVVRGSGETPGGPVATDPQYYDHFSYAQMLTADQPSTTHAGQFAYAFRGIGGRVQQILTGQRPLDDEDWLVEDAGEGLLDRLDFDVDAHVNVVPVIYPAASTDLLTQMIQPSDRFPYFTVRSDRLAEYLTSIAVGVRQVDRYLDALEVYCPDSRISLVGYSQGSMAIHMLLADRAAESDTAVFDQINAVLLLADPLQDAAADGMTRLGYSPDGSTQSRGLIERLTDTSAGRAFVEALDPSLDGLLGGMLRPFPAALAGRTVTYCQVGDLLCAPQLGSMSFDAMSTIHGGYSAAQLTAFGAYATRFFASPVPSSDAP